MYTYTQRGSRTPNHLKLRVPRNQIIRISRPRALQRNRRSKHFVAVRIISSTECSVALLYQLQRFLLVVGVIVRFWHSLQLDVGCCGEKQNVSVMVFYRAYGGKRLQGENFRLG